MNNKVIKLKLLCFYTCKLACEMIKYFGSWGRHMQDIVNQRCVAGGGQSEVLQLSEVWTS